jgi:hypothetical protein
MNLPQLARIGAILSTGALILWLQMSTRFHGIPVDSGLPGQELAERHCQSCHALPAPAQLPNTSWPFVIRWMGVYLGHERDSMVFRQLIDFEQKPPSPQVHSREMSRIGQYFIRNAPSQNDFSQPRPPSPLLESLTARPLTEAAPPGAFVNLLHIDEERGHLYVGTAHDRVLRVLDQDGKPLLEIQLSRFPFDVDPHEQGFLLTTTGDFVTDQHHSEIVDYTFEDDEWNGLRRRSLAIGLNRTVETHPVDLDADERQDLVVVSPGFGFGRGFGKVSVLWATAAFEERFASAGERFNLAHGPLLPEAFEEQVLLDRGGGQVARIADLNEDGHLDVVVLATLGKNELIAYLGRGNRTFETHVIEERHAGWGYSDLAIEDINRDGHLDLIVVNGKEPALRIPPPRPYHGLRILLGDGALGFREARHLPVYGATSVVVDDLDNDGDFDLAVSAFYPDWSSQWPETFQLLENQGDLQFEASRLRGQDWGRWSRITGGDLDGDGRPELVLGSGTLPALGNQPRTWKLWWTRAALGPGIVTLEPTPGSNTLTGDVEAPRVNP